MTIIETKRLRLRIWQENDVKPFFHMNQDPKVIEYLPGPMTDAQVKDFMQMANRQQEKLGYTLWAAEHKDTNIFLGFIGLNKIDFEAHFTPAVEIGWRLGYEHWGKGYATEGALACLEYGFEQCALKEIVAFTVPMHKRSLRVMEKIGMQHNKNGDFPHPRLPKDHLLSMHVLYRKQAPC